MSIYITIYFVTRYAGALAWAVQNQLHFDYHLEHIKSITLLKDGDIIIGTLPINIVYALNSQVVRYIHLALQIPAELRGQELSVGQLTQGQAMLQKYILTQKPSFNL